MVKQMTILLEIEEGEAGAIKAADDLRQFASVLENNPPEDWMSDMILYHGIRADNDRVGIAYLWA